jgi:hypothetical protein
MAGRARRLAGGYSMMWDTPSIFFGGIAAESVVWVTLDDGDSWSLMKLIHVGCAPDMEAGESFASQSA